MRNMGNKKFETRDYQEPEIRLVNMKTEAYEEFAPIYQRSVNESYRTLVDNKIKEKNLPISLRKRLMYEKYLQKKELEKSLESNNDSIIDYIDLSAKTCEIPIIMRKHLMFAKIQNGLNHS